MAAHPRRAWHGMSFHSLGGKAPPATLLLLLATATLTVSAVSRAAAEPAANPGHAIAQRFAEDSARAADAAKKEAARKAAVERRKQAAEKAAMEKQRKDWEAEMLARARAEAEERRQLEAEASRLDALRMAREAKEADAARQAAAAREAEQARVVEEARKAEEMNRAAEALRVAAERAAEEEARKAAEARRIAEDKELAARRAEAERLAAETRRAQNERLAEEGRRVEAQRIEAARKAEEAARVAAEARRAEHAAWAAEEAKRAEEIRKADEARRIAAEKAAAEEARRANDAQRAIKHATDEEARRIAALEADAEVARVAARLRAIREQHMARHLRPEESTPPATQPAPPTAASPAPDGAIGRLGMVPSPSVAAPDAADTAELHQAADLPPNAYGSRYDGRVTILLQMEASELRGRRHESMDPILCVADGCYVSNGPDHPATFMPGRRATRFGNAIGRRAGACNHAYTCVFRDVDIGALPAEVQPVDIRVLRHDRRAPETVETLSTCRGAANRLACTGAIRGDGYTMWVIPESVASRLPVDVFGSTVESSLGREPYAAIAPRRGRW